MMALELLYYMIRSCAGNLHANYQFASETILGPVQFVIACLQGMDIASSTETLRDYVILIMFASASC